jgi:hypothetical protein
LPIATRFVAAILLFSFLCGSVTGQEPQPLTPPQIRQINKVRKNLDLFNAGTRLDVRVKSGYQYTGRLGQMGSTSFTLIDAVLNKPLAIDYLDVKRVKPNRKDYASQQAKNTLAVLPIAAACAGAIVLVLVVIAIKTGDR